MVKPVIDKVRADHFNRYAEVYALLQSAFAYMDSRIDPPSSLHRLDPFSLQQKAREETLFLAMISEVICGCVFAARRPNSLYRVGCVES